MSSSTRRGAAERHRRRELVREHRRARAPRPRRLRRRGPTTPGDRRAPPARRVRSPWRRRCRCGSHRRRRPRRAPPTAVDDIGQRVGGGDDAVERAATVVRHHDRGRAGVDAARRVVASQHALDDDGQPAPVAEAGEVVEGDRRVEVLDRVASDRPSRDRRATRRFGKRNQSGGVSDISAGRPVRGTAAPSTEATIARVAGVTGTTGECTRATAIVQHVHLRPAWRTRRRGRDRFE